MKRFMKKLWPDGWAPFGWAWSCLLIQLCEAQAMRQATVRQQQEEQDQAASEAAHGIADFQQYLNDLDDLIVRSAEMLALQTEWYLGRNGQE